LSSSALFPPPNLKPFPLATYDFFFFFGDRSLLQSLFFHFSAPPKCLSHFFLVLLNFKKALSSLLSRIITVFRLTSSFLFSLTPELPDFSCTPPYAYPPKFRPFSPPGLPFPKELSASTNSSRAFSFFLFLLISCDTPLPFALFLL